MPANTITYDLIQRGAARLGYRVQVGAPNDTFLQRVLFGAAPVPGNATADGVIIFDTRKLTPYLPDEAVYGADPNRVNYKMNFKSSILHPAYFFNEEEITVTQADARVFGEDLERNMGGYERLIRLAADKRDAIRAGHMMAIEKMCADVLLTGKTTVKEYGEQKFPMTSSLLSVAGANLLKDPVATLQAAWETVRKVNAGFRPMCLILNPSDGMNFMSALPEKYIDRNQYGIASAVFGEIDSDGVILLGRVSIPGMGYIEILSYGGAYRNSTGTTNYIPQGKAVLAPRVVGAMGVGRVISGDNGYVSAPVIEQHRTTIVGTGVGDRKKMVIQEQCSPLPLIQAIDGYCVITGIPASAA